MSVDVSGPNVAVTGTVLSHSTPTNPDSSPASLLGWITFSGPLPAGVDATGQIGIAGHATMAVEDTSITNFTVLL